MSEDLDRCARLIEEARDLAQAAGQPLLAYLLESALTEARGATPSGVGDVLPPLPPGRRRR